MTAFEKVVKTALANFWVNFSTFYSDKLVTLSQAIPRGGGSSIVSYERQKSFMLLVPGKRTKVFDHRSVIEQEQGVGDGGRHDGKLERFYNRNILTDNHKTA